MNAQTQIKKFLNEVCVEFGICLASEKIEILILRPDYEANSFVRDIFLAEDLNPDANLQLFRQVKKKFTDRFGSYL